MAKINRYKLRDGVTRDELLSLGFREGGLWIRSDVTLFKFYNIKYKTLRVSIDIGFPDDLSEWNDFDYIYVLDEDFGQPYTPFYKNYGEETNFEYSVAVIEKYNEIMEGLPILEKVSSYGKR